MNKRALKLIAAGAIFGASAFATQIPVPGSDTVGEFENIGDYPSCQFAACNYYFPGNDLPVPGRDTIGENSWINEEPISAGSSGATGSGPGKSETPEPASFLLFGSALVAFGWRKR